MKKPKKTIAVKTLESQLEFIDCSIENLRVQADNINSQIKALLDVKANLKMNIAAHMQEKPDDLPF